MDLREVVVEPVATADEARYRRLMQAHHYLGALPKIGETLCNAKHTVELALGITSHAPSTAHPQRLLAFNRGHWIVEATHHILDTCWDEDRCRIRTGHGPENTTRLRRFAIGVIRSKSDCVAATVRKLNRKPRLVFDYLKMTKNTLQPAKHPPPSVRTKRFTLAADGSTMNYELTSVDPAYLIGAPIRPGTFTWRPGREIGEFGCTLWE